ncbi:hypothetical protein ACVL92_009658 [Bradyrhizobium liaoningense]
MVSTSFMVDTSSHPRAQLHRCVERSAYGYRMRSAATRFYLAPLATKTQMLGAALFYLTECQHGMLSILYPISSSHVPGPSVGISRAWLFKIDFDLCDSLERRSKALHA